MKEQIITFRPSAETIQSLNRIKEQRGNVSAYINQAVRNYEEDYYTPITHTIPSDRNPNIKEATPLGLLGLKQYKEAIDVIRNNGFDLHTFSLNSGEHAAISLISSCRLTASNEFNRYYSIIEGKTTRTSVPLPTIHYHVPTHTIIHTTYVETPLKDPK